MFSAGFAAKGVGLVVLNSGTGVSFKSEGESEGGREQDRAGRAFLGKPKLRPGYIYLLVLRNMAG